MVNALDVADFIVQRCIERKQSISNLKLQKMLYFAWIEYYNKTQERLFNDPFWAWKLGPVVYDVYLSYRVFGAMPISYVPKNDASSELSTDVKRFLSGFTDSQVSVSGTQLVRKSHRPGGAWAETYREGMGHSIIPFNSIERLECQRQSFSLSDFMCGRYMFRNLITEYLSNRKNITGR